MFRSGMCALALVVSLNAQAADDDGDGIDDTIDNCVGLSNPAQTDDNADGYGDDCVSPLATVDVSAVLGSGVLVQRRASVGAFASVGDNATIASAASLDAGVGSSTGVVLGDDSIVSRGAVMESDVSTGASATLGRASRLQTGTDVGASLFLGYASTIGANSQLGDNIVIGNLVAIGSGADLANNVTIARDGDFGDNLTVEAGVIVGPDADVASDVTLRSSTRVRKRVTVGTNSEIGSNVRIARDVTIGANVTINAGARVGAGSQLADYAVVDANAVLARNSIVEGSGAGIALQGGARRFADGSLADRCETYRRPNGGYTFTGAEAVSGLYTINAGGVERTVYCDMTTLGGGWTQISYQQNSHSYSGDARWSALFSNFAAGNVATGSYKLDASGLVATATHFRYSEPSSAVNTGLQDTWQHDFECDVTEAVRGKWLSPGYQNQVPAAIVCRSVATGNVSTNASLTNYQGWTPSWPYERLWIGSAAAASTYHGDYCIDCVVTWKNSGNTNSGVYSSVSNGTGNNNGNGAFWIR